METLRSGLEEALRGVADDVSASLAGIPPEVFDFRKHPFSFLGKAARARFTLLLAETLGADRGRAAAVAAAAELTHTASLLHDDCLDAARYRRGLPTLFEQLGVNGAILVGDLLISLAFDRAGRAAPELQAELVHAVRRMTEGALIEENSRGRKISAADCDRIAALKTGALFRWCGLAACHLSGRREFLETCARLGEEAGTVFQMVDDVLDFEGDEAACGKETLKDIRDGKFTLPLILALNDPSAGPKAEKLLAAMLASPEADLAAATGLAGLVKAGGFAAAARAQADERVKGLLALATGLPQGDGSTALKDFLRVMGERTA